MIMNLDHLEYNSEKVLRLHLTILLNRCHNLATAKSYAAYIDCVRLFMLTFFILVHASAL